MKRWLVLILLGLVSMASVMPPVYNPGVPGNPDSGITDIRDCYGPWAFLCEDDDNTNNDSPPPPPPCDPTYDEPALWLEGVAPPYPVVVGQDAEREGVTILVKARGGAKNNGCWRGENRSDIVSLDVEYIRLTAPSRAWITGTLGRWYPGAKPKNPEPSWTLKHHVLGETAEMHAHFLPVDPGVYEIRVHTRQRDGQSKTRTFYVRVWLLDTTLGGGPQSGLSEPVDTCLSLACESGYDPGRGWDPGRGFPGPITCLGTGCAGQEHLGAPVPVLHPRFDGGGQAWSFHPRYLGPPLVWWDGEG